MTSSHKPITEAKGLALANSRQLRGGLVGWLLRRSDQKRGHGVRETTDTTFWSFDIFEHFSSWHVVFLCHTSPRFVSYLSLISSQSPSRGRKMFVCFAPSVGMPTLPMGSRFATCKRVVFAFAELIRRFHESEWLALWIFSFKNLTKECVGWNATVLVKIFFKKQLLSASSQGYR